MNTNKTFAVLVIVALLSSACGSDATPTPYLIPDTGNESIGKINAEEKLVELGPSDNLIPVAQTQDFFNNDTVRVTNGGIAKLDFFVDQISIRLFNDTAVGDVKADPAGTLNGYVRMKLVFGGLSGEVTKDGVPVHFEVTNGVNIYVLGTQFLVLYDPETSTTYIANFDGTIAYSIPGQSVQFTEAGQLYEISSNYNIERQPLTFTRADIENLTLSRRSTLLATLNEYLQAPATPTLTITPTMSPTIALTPTPTSCQPPAGWIIYTIQSGDSLLQIARRYGTTVSELQAGNCMTAGTLIYRGQLIYVPNRPTITPPPTRIVACDRAAFVADVSVPDGTPFSPGFQFTKIWRLRNAGTCTWTTSYSLVFYRGEQMGGPYSVNIPTTVSPGQTVDVAVGLVAPRLPGSYRGDWILKNASGASFGVGANGTNPIWITINVVGSTTIVAPAGPPDLTVRLTRDPTVSCGPILTACILVTTVEFDITNTSQVNVTSSFQILIEATGLQSKTITVNGLAAGASQNLSETLNGSCFNPDCTARVTIDSSSNVLETNETNNAAATTVTRTSPGTITGTAFSDSNNNRSPDLPSELKPDILVILYDGNRSNIITRAITNSNGVYTFTNLNPGAYIVEWNNGCFSDSLSVNLNAGGTETRNLGMYVVC